MTLLFKKHHIPLIKEGTKTATRRPVRPMVKPGGTYRLKIELFESLPDKIHVHSLYQQPLGEMTQRDAVKEGHPTLHDFRREWEDLYPRWDPRQQVWVVEFRYLGPDRNV